MASGNLLGRLGKAHHRLGKAADGHAGGVEDRQQTDDDKDHQANTEGISHIPDVECGHHQGDSPIREPDRPTEHHQAIV